LIISVAQAQMFFLSLSRILAILIHVPVLGGRAIPNQVKIGLGLSLSIVMFSWVPLPPDTPAFSSIAFGLAMGREILIGTVAGFAAELTFGVLQIAGRVMGMGSGFGSGRIINPTFGDPGSSMNQYFVMVGMLLFMVVDGHHLFIIGLQKTFAVIPLNGMLPALAPQDLIVMTGQLILAGVHMALPVAGTLLLTDLTLGLLARVAPQVHVFFLGIPLKVGLGLLAFAVALSIMFPYLINLFGELAPRMLKLVGG
jgi:flagellar biosynthetic protein FliR